MNVWLLPLTYWILQPIVKYFISAPKCKACISSAEDIGRPKRHPRLTLLRLCQIWCVWSGADNQTRNYLNKTVDGNTLSTVLQGLMPVLYQVEVAAVTRAGVGTRSQPVTILISESTVAEITIKSQTGAFYIRP